jgi:hypothetical protein
MRLRGDGRAHGRAPGRAPGRATEADRRPREAVGVRAVLVAAARAGRRHPWQVLIVAVTASLLAAAAEVLVDHYLTPAHSALSVAAALAAAGLSLLATVFVSGFLCRVVGEAEHGEEHASLGQIARTMPWGWLILADILLVLLVLIGLVLLIIPGLVAVTLLAVVAPVIEIEHRRVLPAMRRSARLARRHVWTVALLATVPLLASSAVESVVPEPHDVPGVLETVAVKGVGEGVIEAAIGLVLVELCHRLIQLDARPRRPRAEQRRYGLRSEI